MALSRLPRARSLPSRVSIYPSLPALLAWLMAMWAAHSISSRTSYFLYVLDSSAWILPTFFIVSIPTFDLQQADGLPKGFSGFQVWLQASYHPSQPAILQHQQLHPTIQTTSTSRRQHPNQLPKTPTISINNGRRQRKIIWWKVFRRQGRCRRKQEAAESL